MNSTRLWKCSRRRCRWSSQSQWFSIMRADMRTSPIVCWWNERLSPDTSSTPSMSPRGSKIGAAEQVRKWLACM